MSDEMMRLLDSVCKGYECADKWIRRYDKLFEDYTEMRKQYEENRNHKAYHDAQSAAHISKLNEEVDILATENGRLKMRLDKCEMLLKQRSVSMGMRIFGQVE